MGSRERLFGGIDSPAGNDECYGVLDVVGWVLHDGPGEISIRIHVDSEELSTQPSRFARHDIEAAYPELHLLNPEPGFASTIVVSGLEEGTHLVSCEALSGDKHVVVGQTHVVVVRDTRGDNYWKSVSDLHERLRRLEQLCYRLGESVGSLQEANLALSERATELESLVFPERELRERSRTRWRQTSPNLGLTWGRKLTGNAFIEGLNHYKPFSPSRAILEVGPGYGRLLDACLEYGVMFSSYLGVDISLANVAFLKQKFSQYANVDFLNADVEEVVLSHNFDVLMSSLTFKHLYPTFESALANLSRFMNAGGMIFFDLVEGDHRYMIKEQLDTYVRHYNRDEVVGILDSVGLRLVGFETVEHTPGFVRLLAIAEKPNKGD